MSFGDLPYTCISNTTATAFLEKQQTNGCCGKIFDVGGCKWFGLEVYFVSFLYYIVEKKIHLLQEFQRWTFCKIFLASHNVTLQETYKSELFLQDSHRQCKSCKILERILQEMCYLEESYKEYISGKNLTRMMHYCRILHGSCKKCTFHQLRLYAIIASVIIIPQPRLDLPECRYWKQANFNCGGKTVDFG